jgi:uncharacterized membrane protein YdjX (TVP38/TMEM64 family)
MPADFSSAAAALALSPSLPDPNNDGAEPAWARPRPSSTRRLSRPYNRTPAVPEPWGARVLRTANAAGSKAWAFFLRLSPLYRAAVVAALLVTTALSVVFLIYSHQLLAWLAPIAKSWRQMPLGWVLVWLVVFLAAFPPMIGYSTAVTVAGFVWGFPGGWPIVATANVAGSTVAFLTSRGVFSGYVERTVGADARFIALGQVLRRDGIWVLVGVRLCPLPYSLSNGFLATIPSITPWSFALATALAR